MLKSMSVLPSEYPELAPPLGQFQNLFHTTSCLLSYATNLHFHLNYPNFLSGAGASYIDLQSLNESPSWQLIDPLKTLQVYFLPSPVKMDLIFFAQIHQVHFRFRNRDSDAPTIIL